MARERSEVGVVAVGPGGEVTLPPLEERPEEAVAFVRAIEAAVDRALARHPRGQAFVYGVHQEMGPATIALLRERYLAAGWPGVEVRPGATGAHLLLLTP